MVNKRQCRRCHKWKWPEEFMTGNVLWPNHCSDCYVECRNHRLAYISRQKNKKPKQ